MVAFIAIDPVSWDSILEKTAKALDRFIFLETNLNLKTKSCRKTVPTKIVFDIDPRAFKEAL